MKALFVSALALLLLATVGVQQAKAQYPGEECRWECAVIYCDYYQDYCDYDCYEVCFPYARQQQVDGEWASQQQVSHSEGQLKSAVREQAQGGLPSLLAGLANSGAAWRGGERTGKVVRMRLETPAFKVTRAGGQSGQLRGPTTRMFAIFQSCLSNNTAPGQQRTRSSPSAPPSPVWVA